MVQRLAKGVLPANTQIQKDAQLAIWKSATVFVNYLASKYVIFEIRIGLILLTTT
jgi:DNA polymerase epsilon subunit 3